MNGVEKLIKGVKLKECPSNFGLKDCKHDKEGSGRWCKYVLNGHNEICEECWRLKLKADNWDIIRWAVNNEIGFVGLYEGIGLEVTNLDLEMLIKLYDSREQKDGEKVEEEKE